MGVSVNNNNVALAGNFNDRGILYNTNVLNSNGWTAVNGITGNWFVAINDSNVGLAGGLINNNGILYNANVVNTPNGWTAANGITGSWLVAINNNDLAIAGSFYGDAGILYNANVLNSNGWTAANGITGNWFVAINDSNVGLAGSLIGDAGILYNANVLNSNGWTAVNGITGNWVVAIDNNGNALAGNSDAGYGGILYNNNNNSNEWTAVSGITGNWYVDIYNGIGIAGSNNNRGILYNTNVSSNINNWTALSEVGGWLVSINNSLVLLANFSLGEIYYSVYSQPCFLANTRILSVNPLTLDEEYIPISKIKKGDMVKGVFSKKPVKVSHCGYSVITLDLLSKYNFPRRIPKDFFSKNLPFEDIYLSGGHRILFHNSNNDLTYRIPSAYISELNKYEIKSENEIKSITNEEECRYYHIQLEDTTEGVLAAGLEVESLEEGDWNFIENI